MHQADVRTELARQLGGTPANLQAVLTEIDDQQNVPIGFCRGVDGPPPSGYPSSKPML